MLADAALDEGPVAVQSRPYRLRAISDDFGAIIEATKRPLPR
jgi:hypothetical protein